MPIPRSGLPCGILATPIGIIILVYQSEYKYMMVYDGIYFIYQYNILLLEIISFFIQGLSFMIIHY